MTLALTTSLSSTITKSELESNFTDIQNKFAAGIDNSDIKSGAAIALSKLAATKEYTTIVLSNTAYVWASADDTIALAPLPGLSGTQADWTLVAANWVISDGGDNSATFDVALAYYNSGTLTDVSILITEEELVFTADGSGNSGVATVIVSAIPYHSSQARVFQLRQGADTGNGVLNAAGFIAVTLLLERDIQA